MDHSRVERPSSTAAAVPLPRRGRLKKLPLWAVRRAANGIKYSCRWQLYLKKWSRQGEALTEEGRSVRERLA